MTKEQLKDLFRARRGYLKCGPTRLAKELKSPIKFIIEAQAEVKKELKELSGGLHNVDQISKSIYQPQERNKKLTEEDALRFIKLLEDKGYKIVSNTSTETSKRTLRELPKPFTRGDKKNVLVIGDIHEPFCLPGYLEFCREQQEMFNCGTVVFIGDIIDANAWSFHEKEIETKGIQQEVEEAKAKLQEWFHVFPTAKITLGNHDLLILRKAKAAGLSDKFIRDFKDIWGAPEGWEFGDSFIIDDVRYIHGSVGNAIKVAKESRLSTVQGHLHTQCFVDWSVSDKDKIFGLQCGCGIDHKSFAFNYSRNIPKKPVIACGVVLNEGKIPLNILMDI